MVLHGSMVFLGDFPPNRKVTAKVSVSKRARQLKDLKQALLSKKINFCTTCHITLTGCRIASTGNFVTRLAVMTGCTVLAAHGGCAGTTAPLFTSGPKTLKEKKCWRL